MTEVKDQVRNIVQEVLYRMKDRSDPHVLHVTEIVWCLNKAYLNRKNKPTLHEDGKIKTNTNYVPIVPNSRMVVGNMLHRWMEMDNKDHHEKVVEVEQNFTKIFIEPFMISGTIDAIYRIIGKQYLIDYKASKGSEVTKSKYEMQMSAYYYLMKSKKEISGAFLVSIDPQTLAINIEEFTVEQLEKRIPMFIERSFILIQGILKDEQIYDTPEKWECAGCAFRSICTTSPHKEAIQ